MIFSKAHIQYHLMSTIPKGAHIALYHPKQILMKIIFDIQREKNCTITIVRDQSPIKLADINIIEPDAFVTNGALVPPNESALLHGLRLIGIGTEFHYTTKNPATHDFVPLATIITEKGVKHLTSSLSKSRSILSGVSPLQPQDP